MNLDQITSIWCNYKNSSGDEIANVNLFYDDVARVLKNTEKREPTSFSKLNDGS